MVCQNFTNLPDQALHSISEKFKKAAIKTRNILSAENRFFNEVAMKLRNNNCILQSREGAFGRYLYLDYGLRKGILYIRVVIH